MLDATTHEVIRRIKLPSHLQEPQQSFRLPDQAFEIGFGVPDRLDSVRTVDGARTPIFEFPKSLPWKVQNALISGKSKIIASSDGNRIAILVPAADHLLVYDRRTSKLKSTPAGGIGPGHFRFSADGDAIAGMEQSERIKIWKTADLESPPETVELTRYFGPKVTSWMTFYLDFQIQGDRITFVKKLPGGDEADVSPPAAATVSRADGSVLANTPLPDRLKGQNAEHIHLALDGRLVVIVTERHKELVFIDTATGRSAVGNLPPDTEIAYNNQALLSEDSRHLTILALEKAKTQEILLDFDLLQVESQIRGAQ